MRQVKLEKLPNYSEIQKRIYQKTNRGPKIGGILLTADLRNLYREQAEYIAKSQLWDVITASIADECINLALIQSKNFEHVDFAKALWHWSTFMREVMADLSRKDINRDIPIYRDSRLN